MLETYQEVFAARYGLRLGLCVVRLKRVLSCKCLHNDFIQNILLFHSRELSIIC